MTKLERQVIRSLVRVLMVEVKNPNKTEGQRENLIKVLEHNLKVLERLERDIRWG